MWIHFVYFKVAIKRGCVHSYHSDTWFPLVHVEPDTEVQVLAYMYRHSFF